MNQRLIGATLLIAGTTIGAGMLALPMTSSKFGFMNSISLLVGMWLYMLFAAYITVEISNGKGRSIAAIAEERLGIWAKHVASVSLLILFWALLAAYIAGSSSILHQETKLSQPFFAIGYTCVFGFFVAMCTKAVDYANRFLFVGKCVAFLIIAFILVPFIDGTNLMPENAPSHVSLHQAIPIFFASFGFHANLPSFINYLEGDRKSIYKSIIIGSSIPLIVYIIWQLLTLGVLGGVFDNTGDVGYFISQLAIKTGHPSFSLVMNVFTFLVITTSFLGVALALYDYISEWFVSNHKDKLTCVARASIIVLTFALPLVFALFYPQGFVFALGFAAVALSILAIILPCLVAFTEKKSSSIFINKGIVTLILIGGVAVIIIELISKI